MDDYTYIDQIATYDAELIQHLVERGRPLKAVALEFGYTLKQAQLLLDIDVINQQILETWLQRVSA